MSDDPEPVNVLVDRYRGGDEQAAGELYRRYAIRLTRLADEHLNVKLAGRVDGEDVVQSVFRTFFRRSARGEFLIDTSAQLWRLLVTLTLRKARGLQGLRPAVAAVSTISASEVAEVTPPARRYSATQSWNRPRVHR